MKIRINVKALLKLAGAALLLLTLYLGLVVVQDARMRRQAQAQARELAEKGMVDQALRVLDHLLTDWPNDVAGLELAARLRTEHANTIDELIAAADAQDRLLRTDPNGEGRQANRRRLVDLYIRLSQGIRLGSTQMKMAVDKTQSRSRAAVKLAEQVIALGDDSSEAHRLLARALENLSANGDPTALGSATLEYEQALTREPTDAYSAERLASIVYERESDRAGSDEVLDDLLKAGPKSIEVRLARHRFFEKTRRLDRAKVELEAAIALAPTDPDVRMSAIIDALQRRDTASARRHVEVLAAKMPDDRRVKRLKGFIELVEENQDVAVDVWRQGLLESGGSDRELTWRLAYTLVQSGRFHEADPLIAQYRRLAGEDDAMLHFLEGARDEQLGRPAAAIAWLEKLAPSIDKAWQPEVSMHLARAYEKINDDSRAILEFRRAIAGSSRPIGAWRSLARLIKKTDLKAAADELEVALAQCPDDPSLLLDRAIIRLERQLARAPAARDWSEVDEALDRAGRVEQPEPGLIIVRAERLASAGRLDEASKLIETALEGPDRKRVDLWTFLADGLVRRGRPDEALKVLARASAPEKAGDRASLRVARSRLLVRAGRGRDARALLTTGVDALPEAERLEIIKARASLLQLLGDKAGARQACLDWARLSPLDPMAGLALLEFSQRNNDDETARLALDVLRKAGGEDEPYALAARALDLLSSNRTTDGSRTVRLVKATELSEKLMSLAPRLPVSRLVRGMVLERNHRIEDAIVDYQVALEGNTAEMALDRLTRLLSRLKRFDELAALKDKVDSSIPIDQLAARLAIDQGDKAGAERLVARLAEGQIDTPETQAALARLLRELGRPEEAEQELRSMVERAIDRPDAWLALVIFQVGQGASAGAAKTIERAIVDYHGPRPDLLLARLRWAAGDRAEATRLFADATARHPDDLATVQAACAFYEATGRVDQAEVLTRKALAAPSCSVWAARSLALILSKRPDPASWKEAWTLVGPGGPGEGQAPGDRLLRATLLAKAPEPSRQAEATTELTALIDDLPVSHPTGILARIDLAKTLFQAGQAQDAARYIAPATEGSVASDPDTLMLAVEILARTGQPDEAEKRLLRLAELSPDSTQAVSGRAWVFQSRNMISEAVLTLEDAAAAAEKSPQGRAKNRFFLNQLLTMKQPEAAERLARRVARLWPTDATLLAEILSARGRADEALDACRSAVDAGATLEPLKLTLSIAIRNRLEPSQAEKARAIADAVVTARPADAALSYLAVLLANHQKRYDDALKTARRAVEADPSSLIALNQLNDVAWIFCEVLDRPADALAAVDRVLKASPLASAMDTRGVILTRLGRFDEAIEQLERCVQKQPVGTRFLHLARAYQKAGKLEPYQRALDRAKKAGINRANLVPKEREEFSNLFDP